MRNEHLCIWEHNIKHHVMVACCSIIPKTNKENFNFNFNFNRKMFENMKFMKKSEKKMKKINAKILKKLRESSYQMLHVTVYLLNIIFHNAVFIQMLPLYKYLQIPWKSSRKEIFIYFLPFEILLLYCFWCWCWCWWSRDVCVIRISANVEEIVILYP